MELSETEMQEILNTQKDLIADLKSKNEKMIGEVADAKKYLKAANAESAERREKINTMEAEIAQTENLQKQIYAAENVLETMNIDFRSRDANLDGLKIENGEVVGNFSWDATKPNAPLPSPAGGADSALSEEKISSMSKEEINKNWSVILENDRAGAIR